MKLQKMKYLASVAAVAIVLSACVPSLNPFYLPRQVVSDGKLTGTWQAPEEDEDRTVWDTKPAGSHYDLTITEKSGKSGEFIATLFEMNKERFLDITPKKCEFATNQIDLVGSSLIRGHLLLRIAQTEPGLKLAFINLDWIDKDLKANPKSLGHIRYEDEENLVLTASTKELQSYVTKHMKELFEEYSELSRKQAPAAK